MTEVRRVLEDTEPSLSALLGCYRDEIAHAWARKAHDLLGTRYNRLSMHELYSLTFRGVEAIVESLQSGLEGPLEAYLADMAVMHLEMGFDISEVIEALLLFKEAASPPIWRACAGNSVDLPQVMAQLDACLRSVIGRVGHFCAETISGHVRAQQERTALILDAAEAASSTLRLEQVLQRIVDKSSETFGSGCALYLWDAEHALLVPQARSDHLEDEHAAGFRQLELSPAVNSLLETMSTCSKPITCSHADGQYGQQMAEALGLESALVVPIVLDDQVFVAVVGSRLDGCPRYTDEDVQLAQGMANAVGLAIRNAQLYEKTRQRLAELQSLQRMTAALLQKLTLGEVLEIVCQEARQLTGATGCALYSLRDNAWLHLARSGGALELPADRMPLEGTLAGQVVRSGKPLLINDMDGSAHTSHPIPGLESLLVIPLQVKGFMVGALDVTNKPNGFMPDDVRVLSLFADGAAIAIESARLHQQAEQLAVMEERQRLACELHDSVTQALYSVTLYAEATRMAMSAGKQDVAAENLEELHRMAREAMMDMRMLIFELHPPLLEEEGLAAALQARLAAVEDRAGLHTEIQVEGETRLSLSLEEELFWIAVEALNNIVKHAKARGVKIRYQVGGGQVCLEIQDDGVGFDPSKAGESGGIGLRGMEGRVQRIQGRLQIVSAPGLGTTVRVETEI